jgi:hypothetical protein
MIGEGKGMSKASAALGIVSIIIFQSCSHPVAKPDTASASGNSAYQSPIFTCGIAGFTQSAAEHIINEIEQPFVVREIKGKILNATGYGWTKDVRVLFEIREAGHNLIKKTYGDENGDFSMKNISDGRYCFKATVTGWQSVIGIIIVNKKAARKTKIVFEMRLGV